MTIGTLLRSYRSKFAGNGYFENIYTDYEVVDIDSDPDSRFIQLINHGALYKCSPVSPHRTNEILPLGLDQVRNGLLRGHLKVLAWEDKSLLREGYFDFDDEVDTTESPSPPVTRQLRLL